MKMLTVAHRCGMYTFPYDGVVRLFGLALKARKEKRPLTKVLSEAGIEEELIPRLKEGATWLHDHLVAIAGGSTKSPLTTEVPAEWITLVEEFWTHSKEID